MQTIGWNTGLLGSVCCLNEPKAPKNCVSKLTVSRNQHVSCPFPELFNFVFRSVKKQLLITKGSHLELLKSNEHLITYLRMFASLHIVDHMCEELRFMEKLGICSQVKLVSTVQTQYQLTPCLQTATVGKHTYAFSHFSNK